MSFHSDLVAAAGWPADLVTAGVVAAAADVYAGRHARQVVRQSGEVWLERLPVEERGTGLQALRLHPYRVHYRALLNLGADRAGAKQVEDGEAKLRTIVARYRGTRPFAGLHATTMADLVAADAVEETVDTDPEDERVLDAAARVTFAVRG